MNLQKIYNFCINKKIFNKKTFNKKTFNKKIFKIFKI